ncbi:Rieske (2Fe-2S) protein [Actinoplanes sp. DH11]|uniref:Rieske (2Fe-2S) protein n=1 Tax=Actinoplanes sp. DH11 TaxID=2857011 RepID=UPI001E53E27E|nr:Rieske (2Fe-2S) protein [Actinoplanes sp. DH11]
MTDVQTRTDAEESQAGRTGGTPTRRGVLVGAGALGATAVLAACGTDGSGTNPNGTDFDSDPAPAGSTTAGGGTGDGGGDSGGSGGAVLVSAAEVTVGGGVITDNLVVTQPTEGQFKAFSKICTHQGCEVSEIKDGQIICRCHNSFFSIKDGAPTSGPAQQPLSETKVKLDGDNVVPA